MILDDYGGSGMNTLLTGDGSGHPLPDSCAGCDKAFTLAEEKVLYPSGLAWHPQCDRTQCDRTFRYTGVARRGGAVSGLIICDQVTLARWVERKWRTGWRELTVTHNGTVVAEIGASTGRRTWWSA